MELSTGLQVNCRNTIREIPTHDTDQRRDQNLYILESAYSEGTCSLYTLEPKIHLNKRKS